uniref:Uncharacterized protein n=1 Tax=Salix viminalis TaxID=40686 RepID=A0A6N2LTX0_SALVM
MGKNVSNAKTFLEKRFEGQISGENIETGKLVKLCVIYPLCFLNCWVLTPAEIDDYLAEGIDIVFFGSSGVLPCIDTNRDTCVTFQVCIAVMWRCYKASLQS